jgi:hypothetical protein
MKLFDTKNIIASLLTVLALCSTGCKKFTEKPYDNRIDLQFTEQYQQVLADAYPARHDMFTDILSDDYEYHANLAQASMTGYFLPVYLYKDEYPSNNLTGPELAYREFFAKIYRTNIVINGVGTSTRGSEEFKAAVKGEALLLRAYCQFILVNLFSKHYNEATAATDLGIPIVTEVNEENVKSYKRATVKETYAQIEKDAVEGMALLQQGAAFTPKNPYHFSMASANAFMSRVMLYKGKWLEAIKYSDAVILEKGRFVRALATDLAVISANGIQVFTARFMDPTTHPSILMNYYTTSLSFLAPTGYSLSGFFVSDYLTTVLPTTDLRAKLTYPVGTVIDKRVMTVKYEVQPNNPNGTFRAAYFNMEEVLLNRAEAVLKSGGTVTEALVDLEVLRKARYTPYTALNAATLTPETLLPIVLLERRKEFIGEGLRWFDVKRLGIKVDHLIGRGEAPAATLMPNDLRTAIQIPLKEQQGNPGIQLNPR